MKKKCVIVKYDKVPVLICEVVELDPNAYIDKRAECEQNFKYLKKLAEQKEKDIAYKIEKLEKEIKLLKGED